MRLGILGGSFNPPHIGHIELARFVLDNLPVFDELWLVPCFIHAQGKHIISFEHRLEMCRLASEGYNRIKHSGLESWDQNASTWDMLASFNKHMKGVITPYMIIGMDEALQITNWFNWEDLISTNRFIVVDRSGYAAGKKKLWFQKKPHIYLEDKFNLIPIASSTMIRRHIEKREDQWLINDLLRPSVYKYIKDNKLYE